MLSADLTRWADATARLVTELIPHEHGEGRTTHLENLWVLEHDHA